MLENPDKRKKWGVRIKLGYYVGASLEHYRYYWGWMRDTNKIRGSDTVVFKHKYITNPEYSPATHQCNLGEYTPSTSQKWN